MTPKLLISVRSAAEAEIACRWGADLIDVKEPARGSLGAADASTIDAVIRQVAGRLPISVALGELSQAATLPLHFAGRVSFAKVGLAGCRDMPDWARRWQTTIARLPDGVQPVAVAYADWKHAAAPSPSDVLALAAQFGCRAVLVDTWDKTAGRLTDYFGWQALGRWIADVRARHMLSVVAGSLRPDDIVPLARLSPDFVAVRGAACAQDRASALDAERVSRLATLLHGVAPAAGRRRAHSAEAFANAALARFTTGPHK